MKSWPEKKLYFHSLTFHYQGVGTVHKPLPEISSWQRSAWDCGFLSLAFWQNPGVQLCVALHCCLVFGRCCIRNIRSQHRRSFETGSGPTEQVKERIVVDRVCDVGVPSWRQRGAFTSHSCACVELCCCLPVPYSLRRIPMLMSRGCWCCCSSSLWQRGADMLTAALSLQRYSMTDSADSPSFTLMNFSSATPPSKSPLLTLFCYSWQSAPRVANNRVVCRLSDELLTQVWAFTACVRWRSLAPFPLSGAPSESIFPALKWLVKALLHPQSGRRRQRFFSSVAFF